jgi:hypothetical protein
VRLRRELPLHPVLRHDRMQLLLRAGRRGASMLNMHSYQIHIECSRLNVM